MLAVERVQAQLRASALKVHETEEVPPFTCFFNRDDPEPWANYAMPDAQISSDLTAALDNLVVCFRRFNRTPRFEYVEAFAPELAPALEAYGFELSDRTALLACTPESFRPAQPVEKLTITRLDNSAPVETVQDFVTVQGRAFAGDDRPAATRNEAVRFRQRLQSVQLYLARLDGIPVGAGSRTMSHDGIAEVAGIATLSPYRRRGIASAITAHISQDSLESGLSALFLTAADEAAGRIYQRVGFQPMGHGLAYLLR